MITKVGKGRTEEEGRSEIEGRWRTTGNFNFEVGRRVVSMSPDRRSSCLGMEGDSGLLESPECQGFRPSGWVASLCSLHLALSAPGQPSPAALITPSSKLQSEHRLSHRFSHASK